MGKKTSEHFHQTAGHGFISVWVVIPRRDLIRTRRQSRPLGDNPRCQLPLERPLTQRIPTIVELTFEPINPFRRNVMGCVDSSGREITKERLIGRRSFLACHPVDGLVR